jgi:hypothetical protein
VYERVHFPMKTTMSDVLKALSLASYFHASNSILYYIIANWCNRLYYESAKLLRQLSQVDIKNASTFEEFMRLPETSFEKVLANIDSFLNDVFRVRNLDGQCPICTEDYDNHHHKIMNLPCGHPLCTNCLGKLTSIVVRFAELLFLRDMNYHNTNLYKDEGTVDLIQTRGSSSTDYV